MAQGLAGGLLLALALGVTGTGADGGAVDDGGGTEEGTAVLEGLVEEFEG